MRDIIIDALVIAGFCLEVAGMWSIWGWGIAALVGGAEMLVCGLLWGWLNAD